MIISMIKSSIGLRLNCNREQVRALNNQKQRFQLLLDLQARKVIRIVDTKVFKKISKRLQLKLAL